MSLAEIQNTISNLSDHERGTLAAWLLESLPPHQPEDATVEGIKEAARRRDELDSGKARPLTADEFWTAIQRDRAAWK